MSRIRGRHTEPERVLRSLLWRAGLRYRLHAKTPVGRPDIVFVGPRVAVFVDGCFWHGCPRHYVRPRSSHEFWAAKLQTNVRRDIEQTRKLEESGWRVCRVWECQVFEHPAHAVRRIRNVVGSRTWKPSESWRVFKVVEIDAAADKERRFLCELREPRRRRSMARTRSTKKWSKPAR